LKPKDKDQSRWEKTLFICKRVCDRVECKIHENFKDETGPRKTAAGSQVAARECVAPRGAALEDGAPALVYPPVPWSPQPHPAPKTQGSRAQCSAILKMSLLFKV